MKNWNGKPYYSLDYMLKERYNKKIYKVALNGGMTCPNRDGKIDTRGCIFCSKGGSGDFAGKGIDDITTQINNQAEILREKTNASNFIAYFQAYTNTYAPTDYLRKIYTEALSHPNIVALSIATRPDCLDKEALDLLEELNNIKPIWIELGLQTINEKTAEYIRRGYPLSCFDSAVKELRKRGIEVIVHTILGLPGETRKDILETIHYLNNKDIQGIKLQLLHVLKDTDLAKEYELNKFEVYTMEEYIDTVIDCVEHLSNNIVIHRITGDGPKKILIAPLWSGNKKSVLNSLHHEFKVRQAYQGKKCKQK
ncbi:radical SAM protein, TIGR01212 family [Anaerofustis stercorihominis DSM 17244]|uniref:Radical SAM protein, TIGR01212 family n=1 Tax=Anaerofustis stercorihominis DSM 17244 TaxID=445971 RepID=B1CBZ5_9FIRM|nr:TIGR01212 family radical SAM protein [Anaerofustis stercorihominis]EDS71792.1 radical SAM protein, TIGR01212 family [Anaerofustis stercorihominis DSM 17244]